MNGKLIPRNFTALSVCTSPKSSSDMNAHMSRLPYRDTADLLKDIPRQRLRRERKAQGLPASEDVGTLSVMLQALRDAAESYLGHEISSALAATPNLVALYQEDVDDAFEYVGLKSLDDPNPLFRMFHETAAAAASYGIGLCHDYTDRDQRRIHSPT